MAEFETVAEMKRVEKCLKLVRDFDMAASSYQEDAPSKKAFNHYEKTRKALLKQLLGRKPTAKEMSDTAIL